jgi:putative ABC transport system permease protein
VLSDLRLALRSLLKTPGFTATALLTLALGIGACAAVFSVVDAVVLRPLAYPAAGRLVSARVVITSYAATYPTLPVNARFYEEWRACPAFDQLALLDRRHATLTGAGEPARLAAVRASANLFATLQVAPVLGRTFAADDDRPGKSGTAVISHRLWRERFAADPAVLGRTVMLDQQPFTIIGVLPAGFRLPAEHQFLSGHVTPDGEPDVFLPKVFDENERQDIDGRFNYEVIGRLKPGATMTDAVAQMNVGAARLMKLAGHGLDAHGYLAPLQEAVVGPARRGLLVLLGAIGAVLLIACLNLATLALARAERRGHDTAVRAALGASRGRLLRQAMLESMLLAGAGGSLGVLVASWGIGLLLHFAPADLPRLDAVRLDLPVLLFALAATVGCAILTGIIPAWRTAGSDAADALRSAPGRATTGAAAARRFGQLLTALETGLSTLLLAVAGLLGASFLRLMQIDAGFQAAGVVSTDIAIPWAKYPTAAARIDYHRRLLAAVAAVPGVTAAAISNALPLQGETWIDSIWTPGDARPASERRHADVRFISSNYFSTLGIPLLAGRAFRTTDQGHNVTILSAQLAARLWPGQDPIGRQVLVNGDTPNEVIGLAGDVRADADRPPVPMVYQPYWDWPPTNSILVARLQHPLPAVVPALRAAIRSVDADVPAQAFRTMDDIRRSSVAQQRFQVRLAAGFALAALILAALGIYGVVAHNVAQRTREIGIRLAFGADPAGVRRLVVGQSLRPIAFGLLGGLGAALAGGRLLASLLYETSPRDPATLALVAVVLGSTAIAACWLPARRATKVDPLVALRAE